MNFLTGARLIGIAFLVYCEQRLSCNFGFLYMLFFFLKDFKISLTEEFIENCQDGALSIEVWGHRVTSTGNSETDIAKTVKAKTRSLTER